MGKAMGERRASTSYPENGRERGRGREREEFGDEQMSATQVRRSSLGQKRWGQV
jgi:hypothetical protein